MLLKSRNGRKEGSKPTDGCVDEIGNLPIDRVDANLFFQLISRRYERGPMLLTSKRSFCAWGAAQLNRA